MTTVIYYPDGRLPECEVVEAESVLAAVRAIWPKDEKGRPTVPPTIELYRHHYSQNCLIPIDQWGDVNTEDGPFYLVNQPADPATWTLAGVLQVIAAVTAVAAIVFAPEPPTATQRSIKKESPNNGLSSRTNQERINGRIPEIVGQVRSTPDLLAVPYYEFVQHREVEVSYMAIGRGSYDIPANQVRDGTTRAQEIPGMAVAIYGPNTSPNSGAPQLTIGDAINRPVLRTQRLEAVNGQVLQPADTGSVVNRPIVYTYPNIVTVQDPDIDLTERFIAGDSVTITGAAQFEGTFSYSPPNNAPIVAAYAGADTFEIRVSGNVSLDWLAGHVVTLSDARFTYTVSGGGDGGDDAEYAVDLGGIYEIASSVFAGGQTVINLGRAQDVNDRWRNLLNQNTTAQGYPTLTRQSGAVQFDLSGTYVINTLTSSGLTLNAPSEVNAAWEVMQQNYGGQSRPLNSSMRTTGNRWVGWFTISATEPIDQLIANFIATNGLYRDNGRQQYRVNVRVRLEAIAVDENGNQISDLFAWEDDVVGSATSRSVRANTFRVSMGVASMNWKVRARRITASIDEVGVVDEIKWRDVYGAARVSDPHFGDITTAQVVTLATDGALAVKERKFNLLVTRRLPRWLGGSSFTTELFGTKNAADILCALSLDPRVGNRSPEEIDFQNLYDTVSDIQQYFGFGEAADFSYTFDDSNMSFEETVYAIASAIGCTAYRQGSRLRLFFERENPNSSLLFNHRNKVPGSETRTVEFGAKQENYDGVEYQYINPRDDGPATYYIPADRSAVNPKVIESAGVRDPRQAEIHAWRAWNKIRYQHTTVEFTGLREASPLILNSRISVADNTRSGAMDGEIRGVDGLEVYLSQRIDWAAGMVMELQNDDGQTEIIPVTRGRSDRHALLSRAPRTPINFDTTEYVRTVFAVATGERSPEPFLVTEKGEQDQDGTIPITAINYDARYYEHDKVFA